MNSLTELKRVIDSMKSHGDDAVDAFQQQLSIIGKKYTEKAEVIAVIKMMQSVGRYLGSKKEDADKDAVPVLNFLAMELEKFILNPDLDKELTNQILSGCIQNYNALKSQTAVHPLVTSTEMQDLKAVILAVDWEISEETLKTFDRVTSKMLTRLKNHKIHNAFLRIIHSMGRYISSKKATAHKDSIVFMHSVFENFERFVNTPDMPFQEKKQLIENDIDAFQNFKRKIASLKEKSPVTSDENKDKNEDEILQPALSHVKASSKTAYEEVIPISPLPESSLPGQTQDSDSPTPALAGKKKNPPAPRDIMDDLFNPKESPADELLDAIHLANIQGPDQKRAMNMNEPTNEELQRDGIKNFTPQRMENEPIPEIGNRLDEFFSLDLSEDSNPSTAGENASPLVIAENNDIFAPDNIAMEAVEAIVPFQNDDDSFEDENAPPLVIAENNDIFAPDNIAVEAVEAIVPFQNDDDSFEDDNFEDDSFEDKADKDDTTQGVINRLKDVVKTHGDLLDDKSLTSVDEDLSHLKTLWQDDPDKTMLLDIIWLLIKNLPVSTDATDATDTKPMAMDDETEPSIPEKSDKPPLGFWGKIKSKFIK